MKLMMNITNAATINSNVAKGLTSEKTKTLTGLYAQTRVSINDTIFAKKTSAKKRGDQGKAMLMGKWGKSNNAEPKSSLLKKDIKKTKLSTTIGVASIMVTNATSLEEQVNAMSITGENVMKTIE